MGTVQIPWEDIDVSQDCDHLIWCIVYSGAIFIGYDSGHVGHYGQKTEQGVGGEHWVRVVYPSARRIDDWSEFLSVVEERRKKCKEENG